MDQEELTNDPAAALRRLIAHRTDRQQFADGLTPERIAAVVSLRDGSIAQFNGDEAAQANRDEKADRKSTSD